MNRWLSSVSVLAGAIAISALPAVAQVGSQEGKSAVGSSVGQGQSGMRDSQQGQTTKEDQGQVQGQIQSQSGREGRQGSETSGMVRSGATSGGSEDIKKVQQALKDKGQDPGPIDGIMGPKTQEALKAFQQQQGLKATGTLDNQTKEKLGIEGGAKAGRSSRSGAASSRSGGGSFEPGNQPTEDDKPTPGSASGKSPSGSR